MMFRVVWEIDIEAENFVSAAQEARQIQLDPNSIATVFKVKHSHRALTIDLDENHICDYCKDSFIPGIHLPTDFDDRENSRDGKVFVARCEACWENGFGFASDADAANHISQLTGWPVFKSYDSVDSVDPNDRKVAIDHKADYHRPYFCITLAQALELNNMKRKKQP